MSVCYNSTYDLDISAFSVSGATCFSAFLLGGATMCGRFTIMLDASEAKEAFDLQSIPADWRPRYNAAPGQPVAAVISAEHRNVEWLRWGLVPSWAKEASIGSKLINARAETIMEKPSFRTAFLRRRCLILADGFYEWQKQERQGSVPYLFQLEGRRPFALAGLWESWRDPQGQDLRTCTIITTSANDLVAQVHDRMPVIFRPERAREWLAEVDPGRLARLLVSYPSEEMTKVRVSRLVNAPENDTPACILPAD